MGAAPRPVNPSIPAAWLLPAALFALPLLAALACGLGDALDAAAWHALLAEPAWAPATALSLWVGGASTALSLALTLWLVPRLHGTRAWSALQRALGAMLAVPHAAFAVGLALLVMPSGLLARLVAAPLGWAAPPDVATVHDPAGLALIAALVLKEVPFLLWTVVASWRRAGQQAVAERQLQIAATMGYGAVRAWWRVLWPQWLPRLALPVAAVWAYGLTVVDMALVLGPTTPPTLAVLAWQWLLDAEPARNAMGAAAALLLAGLTAAGAAAAVALWRAAAPWRRARQVRGDRGAARAGHGAMPLAGAVAGVYAGVLAMLAGASVATIWTFPSLWPQQASAEAWATVAQRLDTLGLTAALALASAASGVALAVAWLETTPPGWDARAAVLVFLPLLVPGVLLVAGLYRVTLALGTDGRFAGLWLAHTLYTAPYALIALAPAWRSLDPRYAQTAHALGRSHAAFLLRVKWPMLLAPLASAAAVGFAVSVTQYLSTQFVGAGRYATLTTEALTLAAGGQRPLLAAFALLQAALPAAVFALALALARRQARRTGGEAA